MPARRLAPYCAILDHVNASSREDADTSGPATDRFKQDLEGTCWWCGAPADSNEHKYKRSDLARILSAEGLYRGGADGGITIRSIRRSPQVRFGRTMCHNCNNARSQPFDLSYDIFSDYLTKAMPKLWERDGLDMVEIFGQDWRNHQLNLARYYAKHFGSLMVDNGVPAPTGLIEFLDGAPHPRDCGMYFVKDEALHFGYEVMTCDGFDGIGYWISPGVFYTDIRGENLTSYEVATRIGYVGVLFKWRAGSDRSDSFLGHVEPVLNEIAMSHDQRRHLDKLVREANDRPSPGTGDEPLPPLSALRNGMPGSDDTQSGDGPSE
jgi:hypothetical protein